ncbi:Oidioi.mRNA.OKI2018_I69.PAR.g8505.t1.cds [Oikopleura dioica]|uniref:non-specific serine/threonine protein kinase n=1 Tax=Oikopleura dioica TaxID=34765 RepID=A0ABN7RGB7_OIKDI|nr:Oidioi.mRNA.OKI2018_I69.PAR.g8505.t1.cds [Oikopleura dioica]
MESGQEEIEFTTNKGDYEMLEVLGQGATAHVQVACFTCPKTGKQRRVAVKRIQFEEFSSSLKSISTEVGLMMKCRHEHIVEFHTSFVVKHELWIIMALHSGGSMFDVIKQRINRPEFEDGLFEEVELATALKATLSGLDYLHSNGQIHRDLKAGNILIGGDGAIALADFGVSAIMSISGDPFGDAKKGTFVGTPCWMAPEVMEQEKGYDMKADIWSFGIVAFELATGFAPYAKFPPMKVIMLTVNNPEPTLDKTKYKKYSREFRKMIERCLQKDPKLRPTAKELLKDKFFKKQKKTTSITPRRVPGSSGRLRKLPDGGWEFSDDEADPQEKTENHNSPRSAEAKREVDELKLKMEAMKGTEVKLSLRIRQNQSGHLQDISFPFVIGTDTPALVAQEMMQNRIIEVDDILIVASNIEDLLEAVVSNPETKMEVTFRVKTGLTDNNINEELLKGFAKLSLEKQ